MLAPTRRCGRSLRPRAISSTSRSRRSERPPKRACAWGKISVSQMRLPRARNPEPARTRPAARSPLVSTRSSAWASEPRSRSDRRRVKRTSKRMRAVRARATCKSIQAKSSHTATREGSRGIARESAAALAKGRVGETAPERAPCATLTAAARGSATERAEANATRPATRIAGDSGKLRGAKATSSRRAQTPSAERAATLARNSERNASPPRFRCE